MLNASVLDQYPGVDTDACRLCWKKNAGRTDIKS